MSATSATRVTDAWLRTPFQAPDVAPMLRADKHIIRINTGASRVDVDFHRYVCRMEDAIYGPDQVGLLSPNQNTVISAHPLNARLPTTGMAFGLREKVLPDKRLRLHYPAPTHRVSEPAVCLYHAKGAAVFLRDVVLGALRARRMLGGDVQILVPDDISARRRAFLALVGIQEKDLVPVPAQGTTRVAQALVPSRSFARDVRIKAGQGWHDLRFLMESEDTLAFNTAIQKQFADNHRRRLYISRDDAPDRRLLNEREAMMVLEPLGFERLVLSDMPVNDLVSAFANAEIIVSPHGSGLTNILFAPRRARVIEIDHPRSDFVAHGLSRVLGQPFHLLGRVPDEARERVSTRSHSVDLHALAEVVEQQIAALAGNTKLR